VKATILVIDEAQLERKINEWTLIHAGYEVVTASNGKHGLQLAQDKAVDVILLDPVLPDISGDQLLLELKRNPRTAQVPVIILAITARAYTDSFKQKGAAAILEKEKALTSSRLLLDTIEEVLPPVLCTKEVYPAR
jgi:CheY-like chemotaxis protein